MSVEDAADTSVGTHPAHPRGVALRVALIGNPNTGKTTLFNQLCGLRAKTANFPGVTQSARLGSCPVDLSDPDSASPGTPLTSPARTQLDIVDLPGIYGLELGENESQLCRGVLAGEMAPTGAQAQPPDVVCVVADATNLERNLMLVGEVARRRLPMVVALTMGDLAGRRGLSIDTARMRSAIGCAVIACNPRTGEGLDELAHALARAQPPIGTPGGSQHELLAWADTAYEQSAMGGTLPDADSLTDRLDRVFTHPILGSIVFVLIMGALFWTLFKLAVFPMDWIDALFAHLANGVRLVLPAGILQELLADGIVTGVGATVIFLPQIALLFFLISLLEDTGYLARAAFVMDRILRPFGLPGHAFVPLLSSHACALPGIMSARAIPDRRDRLATILVAPFMSCSARLPVYVLLISILFASRPTLAAIAFIGCYVLGAVAGLLSALIARRTLLRGKSRPMMLELPSFKRPSLRTALLTTWDRSLVFLKKAGSVILAISILLWWLGSFPKVDPSEEVVELRAQAAGYVQAGNAGDADAAARAIELDADATIAARMHEKSSSFIGRIGKTAQPVFQPLGYDWQLTVGVMASFAAREVFVSTMAVIIIGDEEAKDEGLFTGLRSARRDDGAPVFSHATAWSLLVFYVLAMQCLPTLAVTANEAGGWRWAALQFVWMSGVAYAAAFVAYRVALLAGPGGTGIGGAG